MKKTLTLIFSAITLTLSSVVSAADLIDYPDGYRFWAHVKSMTIHEGHPLANPFLGIHHVYANRLALDGLKSGSYRDGAIFVFDQFKSNASGNASAEGDRVLIGVMVKDSQRFTKTNGWGYEGWAGNSRSNRLVNDGGVSCHSCHTQQKQNDYVFSQWRE
ncbi:MAG: cytochrome P460 family protein [Candidatus Thiodiazotropha sp. (ex Monitilora ramsayi)]|nr:cytochrome P460 family protein [Candidatus Thiodiazotropha sp. (ex Monitilora ramsayi)]